MGVLSSHIGTVLAVAFLSACTGSSASNAPASTEVRAGKGIAPAPSARDIANAWPGWRGPAGNGISPMTGFNKNWSAKAPQLVWQAALADNGFAGPSSDGANLFVVDHSGAKDIVRALSLADGKPLWSTEYPDADADNYGFTRATPAISEGALYVASRLGKILCLDAKTGAIRWQHDLVGEFGGQKPQWDYAVSPLVDGNKVIVTPGAGDAAIVALDKKTGAVLWKGGSGAPGYSTPVIATLNGKRQYVVFQANKLAGIPISGGSELWSVPWETAYGVNAATPVILDNSVFITSGYGHGCALVDVGASGATIRWQNKLIQAHFSSPVVWEGHIYGTGDPGILTCLDPKTGNALWRQPGFEKGGLAAADGVAFVNNGSNGDLVLVKLTTASYQELGRIAPLRGQAWTAPILVNGKVVVRTKSAIGVVDIS